MANKTWFITGTSRGFGREWTKAALERGDRVAATARDPSTLDDFKSEHGDALLPLTLDVTSREAAFGAVKRAHEHFGRLDIVVNNAGYGHFGMVEEISEQEARAQIETNLFGALWVTQAALPFLREQGSGHIVQVSSIGGISAFPSVGIYHASKWGLEGISQALAQEVKEFGINVTLVEPGNVKTDFTANRKMAAASSGDDVYESALARAVGVMERDEANGVGPDAVAAVVQKTLESRRPPRRVSVGKAGERVGILAKRLLPHRVFEAAAKSSLGVR